MSFNTYTLDYNMSMSTGPKTTDQSKVQKQQTFFISLKLGVGGYIWSDYQRLCHGCVCWCHGNFYWSFYQGEKVKSTHFLHISHIQDPQSEEHNAILQCNNVL